MVMDEEEMRRIEAIEKLFSLLNPEPYEIMAVAMTLVDDFVRKTGKDLGETLAFMKILIELVMKMEREEGEEDE